VGDEAAVTLDLYTIDDDDETVDQMIALLRMSIGTAVEAEVIHPELGDALRKWCTAEYRRLYAPQGPAVTPEQEMRAALQRSPLWPFWEALVADQEVRWTGTKSATYFVVDPNPVTYLPDDQYKRPGMFIELRRHTGKTFWTHIGQVRPLESNGDE
jgi:hypothetical protein